MTVYDNKYISCIKIELVLKQLTKLYSTNSRLNYNLKNLQGQTFKILNKIAFAIKDENDWFRWFTVSYNHKQRTRKYTWVEQKFHNHVVAYISSMKRYL